MVDLALCRAADLAPDIVTMIVEGKQPSSLTPKTLMRGTLPLAWSEQRIFLGCV